jgi:phage tail P2-like protein
MTEPIRLDSAATDRPGTDLLYREASPLEKALADTDAENLLGINAELIIENWDADLVQDRNIPFLAWALGVNLWNDDWPEEIKREWMRRQAEFQALRGTRAAFDMAFDIQERGGAHMRLERVVTPPQWFFLSPGVDDAAHERWLATLPELRLFSPREKAPGLNATTQLGGTKQIPGMFLGGEDGGVGAIIAPDVTLENYDLREAYLVEGGVTTRLHIDHERAQDVESFYFPAPEIATLRGSDPEREPELSSYADATFAGPNDKPLHYVAMIDRVGSEEWWNVAWTAREVVSAFPRRVAIRGDDGASAFANRHLDTPIFLTVTDADRLVYESWRLIGPGLVEDLGPVVSFTNYSRMGMQPLTAELTVEKREAGSRALAFANGLPHEPLYLTKPDPSPIEEVGRTVEAAKSLRDKILVDFEVEPIVTFGRAKSFNDVTLR